MSQIEMFEKTVKQFSPGKLAAFRSWLIEFDTAEWDRQIEMASANGTTEKAVKE